MRQILRLLPVGACALLILWGTGADAKRKRTKKLSKKKIEKLVKKAAKKEPDWWDDVELQVPETLVLTAWRAPTGTDAKEAVDKYPSNYVWSKIVPNEARWQEGIKLAHACLKKAAGSNKNAITLDLAGFYKNLLNDYARAIYYYRESPAGKTTDMGLGDCYAALGNAQMAMELYKKHEKSADREGGVIRRYARLGETKLALKVGKALVGSATGRDKAVALIACGDVCRADGKYDDALEFYAQVKDVEVPDRGDAKKTEDERKRIERLRGRAEVAAKMVKLFEALDLSKIPDGSHEGKAKGYAGDIVVRVTMKDGKIEKVVVLSHKETRFYNALTSVPQQIVENQSLKVDAVTSATVSSDAVVAAAGEAIEKAMP